MKIGKKIVSFIIAVLILAAPVAGLSKNVSALENAEFTNTKISNVKLSNAVTSASDKSFWMSMSSDYYYRHLNATEKKLYNRIYDASFPILFNDENVTNFSVDCSDLGLSLYDAKKVIMLFKLAAFILSGQQQHSKKPHPLSGHGFPERFVQSCCQD